VRTWITRISSGCGLRRKPFDAVEIGLTHRAMVRRRPQLDWDTFWNLVTGQDNAGENVDPEEEPGNQMAGWDLRWASPFGSGPWAFITRTSARMSRT
jgi:hypothetical protein